MDNKEAEDETMIENMRTMSQYDDDQKFTITVVEYFMDRNNKPYCTAKVASSKSEHILEKPFTMTTPIRMNAFILFNMAYEYCKMRPRSNNYFQVVLYSPYGAVVKSVVVRGSLTCEQYAKNLHLLGDEINKLSDEIDTENVKRGKQHPNRIKPLAEREARAVRRDYSCGVPLEVLTAKYGVSMDVINGALGRKPRRKARSKKEEDIMEYERLEKELLNDRRG